MKTIMDGLNAASQTAGVKTIPATPAELIRHAPKKESFGPECHVISSPCDVRSTLTETTVDDP